MLYKPGMTEGEFVQKAGQPGVSRRPGAVFDPARAAKRYAMRKATYARRHPTAAPAPMPNQTVPPVVAPTVPPAGVVPEPTPTPEVPSVPTPTPAVVATAAAAPKLVPPPVAVPSEPVGATALDAITGSRGRAGKAWISNVPGRASMRALGNRVY